MIDFMGFSPFIISSYLHFYFFTSLFLNFGCKVTQKIDIKQVSVEKYYLF